MEISSRSTGIRHDSSIPLLTRGHRCGLEFAESINRALLKCLSHIVLKCGQTVSVRLKKQASMLQFAFCKKKFFPIV